MFFCSKRREHCLLPCSSCNHLFVFIRVPAWACDIARLAKSIGGYKEELHPVGYQKPPKHVGQCGCLCYPATPKSRELLGVAKLIRCTAGKWWYCMSCAHWHYNSHYYAPAGMVMADRFNKISNRLISSSQDSLLEFTIVTIARSMSANVHQKLNGTLPTDPWEGYTRAIKYPGLGVRSVGPVGDFLENENMCFFISPRFICHIYRSRIREPRSSESLQLHFLATVHPWS